MNPMLYYLPAVALDGAHAISRADLSRFGLAYIAESGVSVDSTEAGPEGAGVLFCASVPDLNPVDLFYNAGAQEWHKTRDGAAWFGWWKDRCPGPDFFERRKGGYEGIRVVLKDGAGWIVPAACDESGNPSFPRNIRQAEGGGFLYSLSPVHAQIFEVAHNLYSFNVTGAADRKVSEDECTATAIQALAENYRIGPDEVFALDLLRTDHVLRVIAALWPYAVEKPEGE